MKEDITMSGKEADRWYVVRRVIEGELTQKEGARGLGKSERQVRRMVRRVKAEGKIGVRHRLRGRQSNRRTEEEIAGAALEAIKGRYKGFGPTLAQEKLEKRDGIALSVSTVRRLMIGAHEWKAKRGKRRHRAWRERRRCVGMLVQVDGSEHAWFEERGPRCTLIIFVDDATGRIVYGSFEESEDTVTLMRMTREYVEKHGRPVELYPDRDSIYRVNRQATIEEELRDEQAETQYARAMKELGISVRCAGSPQAKGRVERVFETLQDRLVKEMRLEGIRTRAAANEYLPGYLAEYNERFAVTPVDATDMHRALLKEHRLDEIFTIRTPRVVANDYTVRCQHRVFQVLRRQPVRVCPRMRIEVEMRLDGSLYLRHRGAYLNVKEITEAVNASRARTRPPTRAADLDIAQATGTSGHFY